MTPTQAVLLINMDAYVMLVPLVCKRKILWTTGCYLLHKVLFGVVPDGLHTKVPYYGVRYGEVLYCMYI